MNKSRRNSILLLTIIWFVMAPTGMAAEAVDGLKISRLEPNTLAGAPWPVLKRYDSDHLSRIALPLGGIGTGTVSLGGRGDLRDWEIMNRSAKGFVPVSGSFGPFFAVYVRDEDGNKYVRALEGPLAPFEYEGTHGSTVANHGLPRFRNNTFSTAYPFGQVHLSDPDVPIDARLEAFNPLVPADADTSGLPVAILRYVLTNKTDRSLTVSVCGTLPNFIGMDGSMETNDWKGDSYYAGARKNRNRFRRDNGVSGIAMYSEGVEKLDPAWGTLALSTTAPEKGITHRTMWPEGGWGSPALDFWDDFSDDGKLELRDVNPGDMPIASLAAPLVIPPRSTARVTFLITWHFPNRQTWTSKGNAEDRIGNYYTTRFSDAWDVARKVAPKLAELEQRTLAFVNSFCESDMAPVAKEAALFNISTLRTQTCFRTEDGRFYGWEGSSNTRGCCHGSCTHVWNYEQATAFLFGKLALSMREVEFGHATDKMGLMSFRVHLPIKRAQEFGKAAADGQMGCIVKMYRDWQLSGNDDLLKKLWPDVRKALEFCWIEGGWDADRDGVMEGCQHNTMDVEYYGPNPQMGIWYLAALRAAEEMARYLEENEFAKTCHDLFTRGSAWIDDNLFNGEYYVQHVRPITDRSKIAPSLLIGMGAKDLSKPAFQLGSGCLVDQLVGQYSAQVSGLGYLVKPANVSATLSSILKYNRREGMNGHFNNMRSFALGDETALLMASYPKDRPKNPFPYFSEVMTGFEYVPAIALIYEGRVEEGLRCIKDIRLRYDGLKRNPFNEAECGSHYARAMASWAVVPALTGFSYSAVEKSMAFHPKEGTFFWSNGYAWGNCTIRATGSEWQVELSARYGQLTLETFSLNDSGSKRFETPIQLKAGRKATFRVSGS